MKRKEGFPGQLSYIIPKSTLQKLTQNPMFEDLFITDIGYYPHALYHYRERPSGSSQSILIYNVSGYGTVKVAGKTHTLPPDHFFIIPKNTPHYYYADKNNPWTIYWIHLGGKKSQFISKSFSQPVPIERTNTSRINERLELFGEIFKSLEMGYGIEILEYVNLCLPRLLATFTHINQYRSINERINNDPVDLAINYMLENLKDKITLKKLAAVVHLSDSYFSRLFVSRTGFPPIDYFNQLKIQKSCRLLDNRELSIADVAREVGIEDQFYFSRLFKKVMNHSPREYRKGRVLTS
ncbi:AraC family transcriptional regulator [Draconibacterium sp. IB214405]|uniref:AraC family transcriptional regulator n=1 Tax=Draconibacterium sp. IB214405 TaxID=3097352 RepID=UPI002A0ED3B2|nr:AraC family transcriptional regulator [Draconibacterium sp. IB214405]MDX8339367.1 AraC family transcriptional regulator [Draconibacterium sp. IB214405]